MQREPAGGLRGRSTRSLASLAAAFVVASGCLVQGPSEESPASAVRDRWFELWMTDARGSVDNLNVGFSKILINQNQLRIDQPEMDLVAHQGPEDGLRIASGWLPGGAYDSVVIVFSGASAVIDGTGVPTLMPRPVMEFEHSISMAVNDGKALLVDINVTKSLSYQNGTAVFSPTADAVYVADVELPGAGEPTTRPIFETPQPALQTLLPDVPAVPAVTLNASESVPTTLEPPWPLPVGDALPGTDTPLADGSVLAPPGLDGWFVQFVEGLSLEQQALTINSHGGSPVVFFGSMPGAYVWANASQASAIAESPLVTYVEIDRPVEWLLATSRTALRLPDLSTPVIGLTDPQGNPFDGRGVGVAVIDIGIDGTHPDLPYHTVLTADPLLVANYKVESMFQVDIPNTDVTSGHGTHVTGILAGRGVLDPTMRGVAPGVKVYGFGVGEASTTLWTNQALDWVAQNHDEVDPPIRVVSNSWQTSSSYNPSSLTSRLIQRLVDGGVTVVFAAGNGGVDASGNARTSGECQHPAEGVVCVAAYDDLDTGTRAGNVASYSSRGAVGNPGTWPDVSAPGSRIRSASPLLGYVTGTSLARYAIMDGTSMATPHVSGVVALLLQADPNLTPGQVESILESTAHGFADGGAYAYHADPRYNGSHNAKGHGLVDAYAAVQRALQ